jgi:hypothetical protein
MLFLLYNSRIWGRVLLGVGGQVTISLKKAAVLAVAVLLSACAQQEIPYDRTSDIRTIGIVTPNLPKTPTARTATDVGQSLGLIGALVDAGIENQRSAKLDAIMKAQGFDPEATLEQDLTTVIQAKGYTARAVPVSRDAGDFVKSYPPPGDSGVDAYLDVTSVGIGYGYMAAGISSSDPYRPFLYLNCRLVRAKDNAVLMQDIVMYNVVGHGAKAVSIPPDPQFAFADTDALVANPKKTVDGMRAAFKQTADTIGTLVR